MKENEGYLPVEVLEELHMFSKSCSYQPWILSAHFGTIDFCKNVFLRACLGVYFIKRRIRKFKVHQRLMRAIAARSKQLTSKGY
jgi:hypothetical protein